MVTGRWDLGSGRWEVGRRGRRAPLGRGGRAGNRCGGFALLDVIVASIILGIAIAAIIGLTGRALSAQKTGEELQVAAMLADEQLALVLARGPDSYAQRFSINGACDAPFAGYRYAVTLSGSSGNEPYKVSVTISWSAGGAGATRTVTIETLIAPREGDDPDPDRKPPDATNRKT